MDKNFVSRFLKGSAFTSFGTMVSVVFHFLSISLMSRFATKEDLGLYFLILAIVNGFKILGSLGLDLTLVKFMVSEEKEVQEYTFSAIVWVRIITMLFFVIITYLLGAGFLTFFDESIVSYQWYLPLLFILMSFRELFFYVLQGIKKFGSYALIQTVSAIFKFSLVAIAGVTVQSLALVDLINIEIMMLVVSTIVLLVILPLRDLSAPRMSFSIPTTKRMLSFGFPLYINSVFTYISNQAAVFIVGIFLSPVSIAAYGIAGKIPEGFSRLFNSFSTVYYPSLSTLFADNDIKSAQKLINKTLIILATVTFSFVLGGLLFSQEIILLVFSEKYIEVQPAFVLLLLAVCLHLLATLMGYSLVSAGYPQYSTRVNIIAMTIELLFNLLLIPIVGYIGAAFSYILMTFVSQTIAYIYLRRTGVHINLPVYVRPFLILLLVSILYFVLGSSSLIVKIALFGLYMALSLIFVPDNRQSLQYLWRHTLQYRLQKRTT